MTFVIILFYFLLQNNVLIKNMLFDIPWIKKKIKANNIKLALLQWIVWKVPLTEL